MPGDKLRQVPRCHTVQTFISVEKNLEFNPFVHREPVKRV